MKIPSPIRVDKDTSIAQRRFNEDVKKFTSNISFGDGTNPENIKGVWFSGTTPAVANTEFSLTHNLGYIPTGWLVFFQDIAGSIYKGATAWDETTISLKCSVVSLTYKIFVQ